MEKTSIGQNILPDRIH